VTAAPEGGEWSAAPKAAIYPHERPGTQFTGSWVYTRAGLERRKSLPHQDSTSGPSSPQSVTIPTELLGQNLILIEWGKINLRG